MMKEVFEVRKSKRGKLFAFSDTYRLQFNTALPTSEYTVATSQRMNGMLRRRARLPLATGCRHCPATLCQRSGASRLDDFGDHGAGCQRTGALRRRGAAVERAWRPLWKESTVDASEFHWYTSSCRQCRRQT